MGREALTRYKQALTLLSADDRQAVVLRVQLGLEYADVARVLGTSSADHARMAVVTALTKLAAEMDALESGAGAGRVIAIT